MAKKDNLKDNNMPTVNDVKEQRFKDRETDNEVFNETDKDLSYSEATDKAGDKLNFGDEVKTSEETDEEVVLTNEEHIKKLEQQLRESNDKVLRSRAEFENYRKRMQRELSDTRSFGKITAIEEMLPIMDHFKMAMSASDTSGNFETLKQGMKLIQDEFDRCFKNLGVDVISTVGEPFDPNFHEAVSTESSSEVEEGLVIKEWKTGYRMGDRLLRPASVVVSSGPETTKKDSK